MLNAIVIAIRFIILVFSSQKVWSAIQKEAVICPGKSLLTRSTGEEKKLLPQNYRIKRRVAAKP
jgi:hypothetical protein